MAKRPQQYGCGADRIHTLVDANDIFLTMKSEFGENSLAGEQNMEYADRLPVVSKYPGNGAPTSGYQPSLEYFGVETRPPAGIARYSKLELAGFRLHLSTERTGHFKNVRGRLNELEHGCRCPILFVAGNCWDGRIRTELLELRSQPRKVYLAHLARLTSFDSYELERLTDVWDLVEKGIAPTDLYERFVSHRREAQPHVVATPFSTEPVDDLGMSAMASALKAVGLEPDRFEDEPLEAPSTTPLELVPETVEAWNSTQPEPQSVVQASVEASPKQDSPQPDYVTAEPVLGTWLQEDLAQFNEAEAKAVAKSTLGLAFQQALPQLDDVAVESMLERMLPQVEQQPDEEPETQSHEADSPTIHVARTARIPINIESWSGLLRSLEQLVSSKRISKWVDDLVGHDDSDTESVARARSAKIRKISLYLRWEFGLRPMNGDGENASGASSS